MRKVSFIHLVKTSPRGVGHTTAAMKAVKTCNGTLIDIHNVHDTSMHKNKLVRIYDNETVNYIIMAYEDYIQDLKDKLK